jgi:hypothetical protein
VEQNLLSKPQLIEKSKDCERFLLPTHPDHFYRIERYEFADQINVRTNGQCHIAMLVEGDSIAVTTGSMQQQFHYAETFVVPAAVSEYTVRNLNGGKAKLVVSFVKDE